MEAVSTFIIYAIAIIAVSLLGAYMPFIRKLSDGQVHLLISLSAGIFLGILFFLLLPEAMEESIEGGIDAKDVMIYVAVGFLLMLLIDVIIKERHHRMCHAEGEDEEHHHGMASMSAFIGLSIHAFVDGLILAAALIVDSNIAWVTLGGMCIHKFVEIFSLSSTFLLSEDSRKHAMVYLVIFALITPIAAAISFLVLNGMDIEGMAGIPLAFAAGSFMFVTMCDILPEAFHRENQNVKAFVLLLIGIAIAAGVFLLLGHHH